MKVKIALAIIFSYSLHAYSASITPLGDLPGGDFYSIGQGISPDGQFTVGQSISVNGNEQAFLFYSESIYGLGYIPNTPQRSGALAISSGGETIVGWGGIAPYDGFIYKNNQMQKIDFFPTDISADSSVVVGYSDGVAMSYENDQYINLGMLTGDTNSSAYAVSTDGSTIVGTSHDYNIFQAMMYKNNQMFGLGDLAGGNFFSAATAVSHDGSYIAGKGHTDSGTQAFLYHNGLMEELPNLGGHVISVSGVSEDGSIIVGKDFNDGVNAVMWKRNNTGQYNAAYLVDLLLSEGFDLNNNGWSELWEISGLSDDGKTIVGTGLRYGNTEGFVGSIGASPVPLPAGIYLFLSGLVGLGLIKDMNKIIN